jgi:hypothetical protein
MMKRETFAIASIYVPVKRRATLDPKKAQEIADAMLPSSTEFAHECFAELIVVRNLALDLSDVRGLAGAGSWLGHTFRAPVGTVHWPVLGRVLGH